MIPPEIKRVLKESIGLKVDAVGEASVGRAIRERMRKIGLKDNQSYVKLITGSSAEVQELIECVVVPETWFFRDHHPFVALVDHLSENWDRSSPLSILSIPCSSGEEPYSIAMALIMAGIDKESFRIDAVDISRRSLERARAGVYSDNSFRSRDLRFRDIFFTPDGEQYRIKDVIRQRVRFAWGNIFHPPYADFQGCYDVIFCRNILIYFDEATQKKALAGIERSLRPGGVLFTGHAEASLFGQPFFESLKFKGAFGVRKKHVEQRGQTVPERKPKKPTPVRENQTGENLPEKKKRGKHDSEENHLLEMARKMVYNGNMNQAESICNKLLEKEPSPLLFFLLGVIRENQGKVDEAISMLRKAVYLNPKHHESLTLLSLLAKRTGDEVGARNYWRRATKSDRDKRK